jgi:hypothetical protein
MKESIFEKKICRLKKLCERHFIPLKSMLKRKYILLTDLETAKMELLK